MKFRTVAAGLTAALLLEGCAGTPMGPTVQVMPAPNKPFEVFAQEQSLCKQYAEQQVGGQAEAANDRAVGAALLTTALGAGLGAAVGGGHGAGVGAATGGVVGAAIGTSGSQGQQHSIQQQYNTAYTQCMYAKGNQVAPPPAPVAVVYPAPAVVYTPPPAVVYAPPPGVVYAAPPATVYAPPPPNAVPAPPGP